MFSNLSPQIRFYLDHTVALELAVEGRGSADPQTVMARLNGKPLFGLPMKSEWGWNSTSVRADQLQVGLNLLELKETRPCQWRTFRARPLNSNALQPRREGSELWLPFGQSLAYNLQLSPQSKLQLELKNWTEPGAAPPEGAQLSIGVTNEDGLDRHFLVNGTGPKELSLDCGYTGSTALTLEARGPDRPLPGQLGLHLTRPFVEPRPLEPEARKETVPPRKDRPNVVIYLIDTLRADHLGCYGYPQPVSPNIDRFRRDAVLFANLTAQSSWTKTATASILTSMLPRDHGALDFGDQIVDSAVLLSQVLQKAGYATRAVATNPFVTADYGFDRGFDNFQYLGEANCRKVNDKALPWLQQHGHEKPFFLYLHTREPHLPYDPPEPHHPAGVAMRSFGQKELVPFLEASWLAQCRGRPDPRVVREMSQAVKLYDGEVATNDAAFGELVSTLKGAGLYDNTLIVVVSDHGEEFLEHGYLGHMSSLYQELLHVPLLIKFPQAAGAGSRIEPCWQQIDIAPTILSALGIEISPAMAGVPYRPGGPTGDPNRPAFFSIKTGQDGPRFGLATPWLLDMDGVRVGSWIFNRTYACATYYRLEPRQLYDLSKDPRELDNQAYRHQVLATRLNASIQRTRRHPVATGKASAARVARDLQSLQYVQ